MASQMESAVLDQVTADISDGTDDVILRANGSVVTFDGFLTLYTETHDDEDKEDIDEKDRRLPPLTEGSNTKLIEVRPNQHFTQPPPRYSEASLVKKDGRAGHWSPLHLRLYPAGSARPAICDDGPQTLYAGRSRGRLVTSFLMKFFTKYVDYDFTANLEEELDAIAAGHVGWTEALRQFWIDFSKAVEDAKPLTITEVIDHLNRGAGHPLLPCPRKMADQTRANAPPVTKASCR